MTTLRHSRGVDDLEEALMSMDLSELSKTLFDKLNDKWHEVTADGILLDKKENLVLNKAQTNLGPVLDNDEEAQIYCDLLMKLAEKCNSNIILQRYVFTRIEEILGVATDFSDTHSDAFGLKHASKFTSDGTQLRDAAFVRAINSSDFLLQKVASVGFARLLSVTEGDLPALIEWVNRKLESTELGVFDSAIPVVTSLVKNGTARELFIKAGGLNNIVSVMQRLGSNGNAQLIYELSFILWTLSLNCANHTGAFLSSKAIVEMCGLIGAAPSRKVVRMAIAMLRTLAATENSDILSEMLTEGLDKLLGTIIINNAHKQAADADFEADVIALEEILLRNYRELSTYDRWVSEVSSGALRWGIVHTEKFWRENNRFIEANDFSNLKLLINSLRAKDTTVLCIALYDLGEFTRFYPNGRLVVSALGGKDLALELLSHEDSEVQTHALQCISKIMVTNWEFMR